MARFVRRQERKVILMNLRLMAFLLALVITASPAQDASPAPRNIIVMIGDGMGVSQVTAGRTAKGRLALERFRHLGLLLTHASGDDYVTDSAAGATALATGVATRNGMIGMGPDSLPRTTVLEQAKAVGKKTGVVTVCSITHATPASFLAHVPSRTLEREIAYQIARSDVDLALGSGWGWFLPKEMGGRRTDGLNLLEYMERRGFRIILTEAEFREAESRRSSKIVGLFAENHVGRAQERRPSLSELTEFAIRSLERGEKGFVLMVEGSQIDWASHDNMSDQTAVEMADFDDAVRVAVEYAEKHPTTLVIVTADHETGGYALLDGSLRQKTIEGGFVTKHHTAAMVPLFAMGPGAERFTGIRVNSEVGTLLLEFVR